EADLELLGRVAQLMALHPRRVAFRAGDEARAGVELRAPRRAADQVHLVARLVGPCQQRPREALVQVAVGDRVAAGPRTRLLEQQEPRGAGRGGGEVVAELLGEDGAGGVAHVKRVSTPATTNAAAHTASRLTHALRS